MFPISDDNSDVHIIPVVNYALIAASVLVFVFLQGFGGNEGFLYAFSLIPKEIVTGVDIDTTQLLVAGGQTLRLEHVATPLPVYFNFISSMFMHGDLMHLFGNMLFLWIFGDNIENLLGHVRYAVFYLVCGMAAALSQIALSPDSIIPMVGASGAISGVLGGYLLLFPRRKVVAFIFRFITTVPAYVALGIWIAYQIILGYFAGSAAGGVAYAAHIGGFAAGLLLIKLFALGRKPPVRRV